MANDKRYVVTLEAYVFAENDYMARKRAHEMNDKLNIKFGNAQSAVTELGEQPFGSFNFRKLEDHSRPTSKDKKDKNDELPF